MNQIPVAQPATQKPPGVMFWVFLASVAIYAVGETVGKKWNR